ncbi:MAG: TlpA disulfide reductase family protein [Proteobacteria bacterium]|nr:TlpA disulfide reductase family protein [Pseudomonadota bacterium]MDA0954251.1 TlpA disulfide reductase family protein [Pseudomonadota bacterium]
MKRSQLFAFVLLVGFALTGCQSDKTVAIDNYRGQWVVVNYWAEWCKPCIKEIPELNDLNSQNADVTVLGVNFDGAVGDELARQLDELKVAFETLPYDPSAELGIERPRALPTTVIISPEGDLKEVLIGPQTQESLLAYIRS